MAVYIPPYFAPGVKSLVASSAFYFLGLIDDNTVLKYPHSANADHEVWRRLETEAEIYKVVGEHDRIIKFKGLDERGLLLEYAPNGSVTQYLRQDGTNPPLLQRLKWAIQAAEGLALVHEAHVLHCDINANNLLLDKDLNIKLVDFQGRHLSLDGTILLNGLSSENVKSSKPQPDCPENADEMTDIFALGSAIYFIITGHEPFPDLDPIDDDDEAEIVRRYTRGEFPELRVEKGGQVLRNCWAGNYATALEVVEDLRSVVDNCK